MTVAVLGIGALPAAGTAKDRLDSARNLTQFSSSPSHNRLLMEPLDVPYPCTSLSSLSASDLMPEYSDDDGVLIPGVNVSFLLVS